MGCLVCGDVLYGVVFVFCGMGFFALRVLVGGIVCSAVMFVCLCCYLAVILLGCIFAWLYCCFGLVVMLSDGNLVGASALPILTSSAAADSTAARFASTVALQAFLYS